MEQIKPLTLRHNFSWTFIGNTIYAACQWGMLVVMAKLGSPEIVGQFTLGLAVTAPVFMFTNLQLRSIQATDAKKQYLFSDYLELRLIGTGFGLVAITVITFLAKYPWEISLVILLVALAKAFESISDVYYGLLQQHERMDRIAISLMIKGPLSLTLLGMGVYLSSGVVWGVVGLVFAWSVVLFVYDIPNGVLILDALPKYRWHLVTLKNLAWLSLPLGLVMMLISLNTNIPRYFIEQHLGERELGIFAAIAYLMVVGSMIVNALGQSASPRLAKYYAAGNTIAFRRLLLKLIGIALLLGGGGVLIAVVGGEQILTLLYQPEYAQHTSLFVWLMIAAGIGYVSSFMGYGMTAVRYFRIQLPLFAAATTSCAIACLLLVPRLELLGAAIALLISVIVQAAISYGVIIHALHKLNRYNQTQQKSPI
ncbi:oligosaccharide flippase family protein [Chlorogloeopsis sp. ULAP01]|uniref:lipopolysaccharide biosynthesis protein n=1 Tax=Chlorogloeopsis sp. ULAP01 TaxID=3056483 RepID=UPI0025AB5CAA|nr:oligosaccharide flippase family protein [Chlorogloeopsis sp. ULAP01]MDM9385236.1 oligosaccharide flippase family protein [Chlorogloeopsis sp. ULAP01]